MLIKPAHIDQRGEIIDILTNTDIDSATIVTFNINAIRGNHYHKNTTQWNYVLTGEIDYYSMNMVDRKIKNRVLTAGCLIISPPNIAHALKANQESKVLILTKGPRSGDNYETDTFRLMEPLV